MQIIISNFSLIAYFIPNKQLGTSLRTEVYLEIYLLFWTRINLLIRTCSRRESWISQNLGVLSSHKGLRLQGNGKADGYLSACLLLKSSLRSFFFSCCDKIATYIKKRKGLSHTFRLQSLISRTSEGRNFSHPN